ncbi:hypothetical protein C8Q75DRAFT_521186 [Abortiporus biennis]|nr:hypothetical protein C8Q75DRAFT_521186 [Abortiporus biennis]
MLLALPIIGFIISAASAASAYHHGYGYRAYPRERFDVCGLCEDYYDPLDRGYFDHDVFYKPYASDYHGAGHHKSYHYEARDVADLELREIIAAELVRRAEALTASHNGYNNNRLSQRELDQFVKRTIPVKLSKSVKSDFKYKLASTWKDGKDPKQAHEEIARNHAKNVPGAVSATVTRAAHPSGSDPNAVDHIQVVYHDKNGKAIPQDATHEAHHIPTGREKDGIDVKKLWEGHQADKDAKKAAKQ